MPARYINNNPYVDGGIREVAPLSQAINDGATDIISVVCEPRDLKTMNFNSRDVIALMSRDMDIVTNETVNNDLDQCEEINQILKKYQGPHAEGPLKGKKHINLLDIRPDEPVKLDLENFNFLEIRAAMEQGWITAQKKRKKCDWLM
jgi:NTE family protein